VRHVSDLPLHQPGARLAQARRGLGDPEVGEARDAVDPHQDVLRREVAMHEPDRRAGLVAQLVGGVQAVQRVDEDAQGHRRWRTHTSALGGAEQPDERGALDVLHHQAHVRPILGGVEDGHHVGVTDPRRQIGLLHQIAGEPRRLAQVGVHQLDRHVALESTRAARPRQVDGRHPAAGDGEQDLVAPEPLRLAPAFHAAHLLTRTSSALSAPERSQ
jgi:hypothetical protein